MALSRYFEVKNRLRAVSLLGLTLLLLAGLTACGDDPTPVAKLNGPAPTFRLTDLSGKTVSLRDYAGKPLLINFWATWCLPCKTEMPEIQKLVDRYKNEGLVVLGIASQENASKVKEYIENGGFGWEILLDDDGAVKTDYRVVGYPSSFFVDKNGTIRAIQVGGSDETVFASQLLPLF